MMHDYQDGARLVEHSCTGSLLNLGWETCRDAPWQTRGGEHHQLVDQWVYQAEPEQAALPRGLKPSGLRVGSDFSKPVGPKTGTSMLTKVCATRPSGQPTQYSMVKRVPWRRAWHCPEGASHSLIRPSLPASAETMVRPEQAKAHTLLAQPSRCLCTPVLPALTHMTCMRSVLGGELFDMLLNTLLFSWCKPLQAAYIHLTSVC